MRPLLKEGMRNADEKLRLEWIYGWRKIVREGDGKLVYVYG
jgi:hypothetical protein